MDKSEFKVGDTVRVDRYNHIDDIERGVIVGYGRMPLSGRLTYKINLGELVIQSTGISIMESKHYIPVSDNERHEKKGRYIQPEKNFIRP